MKKLLANLRVRYLLAALAGLMLAAAFPGIGISGFAWVAPAVLLACARGKTGGQAFRIGYVGGLAHYLLSLGWLLHIPVTGYPILGWFALSVYLAVFPATWVWLMYDKIGAGDWFGRQIQLIIGAAVWVGLEMTVSRLFTGFPWNLLGASQYQMLPLIQVASVTGVYGVSFLIIWLSLALYAASYRIVRHPGVRLGWQGEVMLPLGALVVLYGSGMMQLHERAQPGDQLHATLVQPSIPQTMIWDEQQNDRRFADLLALSTAALTNETDVLIWPEAAVPQMVRYDEATYDAVSGLARSNHVWMIIGSDDAVRREHPTPGNDADYFNASFLISPAGELANWYHKRQLVVFGEYVPLTRWLPFLQRLTPITGGFTSGTRPVTFDLILPHHEVDTNYATISLVNPDGAMVRRGGVKTSTLICFEDVFPHLARHYVKPDTDFLVNLTNDGWFGEGAEQWQHAASAVFRAVENGVPLIRCANNGLTCWIDAHGVIRKVFRDASGSIYGPGALTVDIPLRPLGTDRTPTFYNEHGDIFGWSCVVIAVGVLLRRIPWPRPRKWGDV